MRQGLLAGILLWSVAAVAAADVLQEVLTVLSTRHVDPPPAEDLLRLDESSFAAYLKARDPYSAYLSAEQYQRFRQRHQGGVGIGIQLFEAGSEPVAIPYPGGPAYRAGMLNRSRILRVDGRAIAGQSLDEVAASLKGPESSELWLEIEDQLSGERKSLRLRREMFVAPSVSYLVEDDVPLLRVWAFRSRGTMNGLRRGIERLNAARQPVVVDLRNAQGGDLFEALDAVSLFIPGGESIAVVQSSGSQGREFKSLSGRKITQHPAIFLIGSGTASAAEVFVKAVRWHGAALLVGENTYGKCYTQTLKPLSNGGALKFSNGKVLGPKQSPCSDEGIRPDVPIADSERKSVRELLQESAQWVRAQSNRTAILQGHEAAPRR